jgi:hypothetical protein
MSCARRSIGRIQELHVGVLDCVTRALVRRVEGDQCRNVLIIARLHLYLRDASWLDMDIHPTTTSRLEVHNNSARMSPHLIRLHLYPVLQAPHEGLPRGRIEVRRGHDSRQSNLEGAENIVQRKGARIRSVARASASSPNFQGQADQLGFMGYSFGDVEKDDGMYRYNSATTRQAHLWPQEEGLTPWAGWYTS